MTIEILPLTSISRSCGTQMRISENAAAIEDYAEAVRNGSVFPPLIVFTDGKHYWLADGFHRFAAFLKCGLDSCRCDVREGTLNDAKRFACEANKEHGLQRTQSDKRNAIKEYLTISGLEKLSNSEIGKRLGVSHHLVCAVRGELKLAPSPKSHVGGGGKAPVGNFQKPAKAKGNTGKNRFTTLYNVSLDSPEQFVSVLRTEFTSQYLDSLLISLQQSLLESP